MQAMQKVMARGRSSNGRAVLAFAAVSLAVAGCGTAIETPLPDVKAASSTSLSQAERDKAVAELNRKRATHEQDAEQQIEQSR